MNGLPVTVYMRTHSCVRALCVSGDLLDAAWRLAVCRVVVFLCGFVVTAFGFVSLGPHRVLQSSSAGLIVVLVPGCCLFNNLRVTHCPHACCWCISEQLNS